MSGVGSGRDDTSHRSMSTNERRFIRSCAMGTYDVHEGSNDENKTTEDQSTTETTTTRSTTKRGKRKKRTLRLDGREGGESRPVMLTFGRSHGMAECSVRLGGGDSVMTLTRAVAQVSCELVPPPNPDRPNDGAVRFGVDLSPMSSVAFEAAAPVTTGGGGGDGTNFPNLLPPPPESQRLLSNRIVRLLERTILTGGAVDVEALCVRSGRFVWRLAVDVTLLDNGGNAVDVCVLAAMAALRHFRLPEMEMVKDEPLLLKPEEKEPSPLALHHTPLTASFALFCDETGMSTAVTSALVDPTDREELAMDGVLTVGCNRFGELCSLDFPGGCELRPSQLSTLVNGAAKTKCLELCALLEEALTQADEQAQADLLQRLRQTTTLSENDKNNKALEAFPEADLEIPPADAMQVEKDDDAHSAAAAAAEREKEYLRQALDYSVNHFAMPVREDKEDDDDENKNAKEARRGPAQNSLLAAMLQSAAAAATVAPAPAVTPVEDARLGRTKEAEEEFEQYARQATAESSGKNKTYKHNPAMEDDEEEETVTLQTEFSSIK